MRILNAIKWLSDHRITETGLYRETVNEIIDRSIIGWWWTRAKMPKSVRSAAWTGLRT